MKKKIALICCVVLVAVSLLGMLAACKSSSDLTDDELKALRSNLYNLYKDDATEQNVSYQVRGEITGTNSDKEPIKSAIKWTIEGTDKVKVSTTKDDKDNYTVKVPDIASLTESITYTLKATLVNDEGEAYKGYNGDESATYTVSFNRTVTRLGGGNVLLQHYLPAIISKPAMDTEYNLSMYNGSKNYVYYFTGAMNGNFYASSTQLSSSKKVKLESADDGFYIYFMDGSTKKYLSLTDNSSGSANPKANVVFTTTSSTVFSIDASLNGALKATISTTTTKGTEDSVFYLGGQTTYETISASSSYYVTGSNAANVDKTQAVVRLVGDGDFNQYGGVTVDQDELAQIRSQFEANPVEGTAYKLAVYKGTETLYFKGATQSQDYYLDTVKVKEGGVDCYIETSGDGFYIYFMNSSNVKTYVTIVLSGTHVNAQLTTSVPTNGPFKMDTTLKIPYMEFGSGKYLLTSSGTYTSIGGYSWPSTLASTVDVSVWAMRLMPSAD